MADFEGRRAKLLADLTADAYMIVNLEESDPVSMVYLTGYTGEGVMLLSPGGVSLLTDSRYTEQAAREVPQLPVDVVTKGYLGEAAAGIEARGFRKTTFASQRLTYYWVERLRGSLSGELIPLDDPVAILRRTKEPSEIATLREAIRLTEVGLERLVREIRIGDKERELALRLESYMREAGADGVSFGMNVSAGENTALPHYRAGDRRLARGDLLLFDVGARFEGYCADITRTFAVGEASDRAGRLYEIVLAANREGIAAVHAGAKAQDVDGAARQVIDGAGYGDRFGHGLGHGIGLELHEAPTLSSRSEDTLVDGMVTTVEPGVYLPGFGGIRIEDDVAVTADGCDVLTHFPKDELMVVGT